MKRSNILLSSASPHIFVVLCHIEDSYLISRPHNYFIVIETWFVVAKESEFTKKSSHVATCKLMNHQRIEMNLQPALDMRFSSGR